MSSRVVKDHFALHPPWELLPQGEFVEGGGLTKTVISLRIKDIISGCVRVGSGPMGGGGCFSFGVQTSGEYISTMFGCI